MGWDDTIANVLLSAPRDSRHLLMDNFRSNPSMSALSSPQVSKLLDHLFAEAARNDPAAFDRFDGAENKLGRPASGRLRAELMSDIYMPVTPDVGRLLYVLARNRRAKTIVEFGTSF